MSTLIKGGAPGALPPPPPSVAETAGPPGMPYPPPDRPQAQRVGKAPEIPESTPASREDLEKLRAEVGALRGDGSARDRLLEELRSALTDLKEEVSSRAAVQATWGGATVPKPVPFVGVQVVRETGGEALVPETEDDGFTWLLPFAPRDGESRTVYPGQTILVQTGLRLYVPKGVRVTIFQPWANGRPGTLIPVMELDHRVDGELEVPVAHRAGPPLALRPGQRPHPLVLRATSSEGRPVQLRVDRAADPLA